MKISVCYKEDGSIYHVHSYDFYFDKGLTEEQIVAKQNEINEKTNYEQFKTIEVSDEVGEVITMLLGEKKYKRCKDIEDLLDELEAVNDTISGVSRDIFDAAESCEKTKKLVEEMKAQLEGHSK